ncbi:ERAD-associated protein [Marasmius crinis-equi]|uniref:ERAD-associated protein n=1 Tax=Marasmius crinis-equi TaxID=585013 RepID=A0ABR3G0S9_9AGAR
MTSCKKMYARKAAWLAFGLVALAAIASTAQEAAEGNSMTDIPTAAATLDSEPVQLDSSTNGAGEETTSETPLANGDSSPELDQAQEASRAYKQAMYTLSAMTAHPPSHTYDSSSTTGNNGNSVSLFSSLMPNLQGKGPVGSLARIINKLYSNLFHESASKEGPKPRSEPSRKAIKVIDLLQHSAELGNMDALYAIAKISLFPPTSQFSLNPQLAYDTFSKHVTLTGNETSQSYIAFFHATGYHDVVPVDQAKAQLYYTFAANGGDKAAQMALGYRYWSGIGTLQECRGALDWYERAAAQAMEKFLAGPPGGRTLPQTPTSLADLAGGVYGPGASVASTGFNVHRASIKAGVSRASGETWEDIVDYYLFNADRGETDFAFRLGKIYYQGSIYASPGGIASGSEGVGAIPRDYGLAKHYFEQIARLVWPRDPPNPLHHKASPAVKDEGVPFGFAAASAGYLGRMYLRGEGVKADPAMAKMWFERGVAYGDRECQNGLGIIYRDGLVPSFKPDLRKALDLFKAAASQELAEAQVNVAKLYFRNGDISVATANFEQAIRLGSTFEAYYYLGQIHWAQATNPSVPPNLATGSCAMAVSFYKMVTERGVWDDDLLREAEVAWMTGTDESRELAILKWWVAAERGSEIAQTNLAYVLDQDKSVLRLTRFSPITPSNDTARLALTQWTRAAAQHNIDALVKVADYYYHGLGVADEPEHTRFEKAVKYYQAAADTQQSALAMWNLGWMYENGVGVPQDFHLAKRHYDQALETNSEAYLPVALSLVKLYMKSIWHTLMGGEGGLNLWAFDEDEAYLYHDAPKVQELDGRPEGTSEEREDDRLFYEDEEGPWYLGKARDEFRRRRNAQKGDQHAREEEDPIEWAKARRDAERERDSDFGPEDYFEAALRGGHRDEDGDVDEFSDSMLLVLLVLTVSVLIWFRTRMVRRMRHDQQQQQQQQNEQREPGPNPPAANGLFPPHTLLHPMDFDFSSLAPLVQQILSAPGTDLGTISAKRVRRELLALDPSLTPEFLREYKDQVDEVITNVFGQVSGRNEDNDGATAESNRSQSPDDEEEEGDEEAEEDRKSKSPKKSGKAKKNGSEMTDAQLARKLSSEINGRSSSRRSGPGKATGRGSSNGTPKKGKKQTRKSAAMVDSDDEDASGEEGGKKTRKKRSTPAKGGFAKEYMLSAPLATVLQVEKLSRPQVVKQLWEYIKGNERQNPQNKREIICDDKLRAVFNADKIDMFKMNKVLGQHLHEQGE